MNTTKSKFNLDFIGIGAEKSGTTWLFECLLEHPQIFVPKIKEIAYYTSPEYNNNYKKGIKWYESFFKDAPKDTIKGEITTSYIEDDASAELIFKDFPEIKILVCLRDPVEKIYSTYWWRKANIGGHAYPDTFDKYLLEHKYVLKESLYYDQLKKYYDIFPKKNIYVVLLDEIKENPDFVVKNTFEFLDVDPDFIPSVLHTRINESVIMRYKLISRIFHHSVKFAAKMNIATNIRKVIYDYDILKKVYLNTIRKPYKYPPMTTDLKLRLRKYYAEDINKLEKLTNKDLSNWK